MFVVCCVLLCVVLSVVSVSYLSVLPAGCWRAVAEAREGRSE